MGMKRVPGGLLVAIEGIDGAGKTTVARALESWLVGVGALVVASKEPTRGPWGMKMRESAASGRLSPADERRFLLLDRKQHIEEVIAPALRLIALAIFAIPATIAGYSLVLGVTKNAIDSTIVLNLLGGAGGLFIGIAAIVNVNALGVSVFSR